ncbi:fatty-acyl-CoA synthase [Yoonia rosea]|uniref:Fatty-acyl-CoA synthase n=1 Tax=Yoonia rosea TaxID=287098 RepID=A0A1R3W9A4_9RHOB|nr:class I adenylate-forming enzyme family protein [Yoonia rosea]SIT74340.1 fatty-acyl-CoA synthase [Yoonia rosea]
MDASIHSTISDLFCGTARRYGNRIALIEGDKQLSYRDLADHSAQVAHQFAAHGIKAGDHVGVALRHSISSFTSMLAIWMLNAVAVPIDFRIRPSEREKLAEEFDLAVIVQDGPAVNVDYRVIAWNRDFETEVAQQPITPPDGYCGYAHPATISLTSGTTGRPIGFVQSHKALVLRMMGYSQECAYPVNGRAFMTFPLSFSASRNHTLGQLLRGNTIYFHPPTFGAKEIAKRLIELKITFAFVVPAMIQDLLELAGDRETPMFPDLQLLYTGGAGMLPEQKIAAQKRLSSGFLHCFSSSLSGTVSTLVGEDVLTHPDTEGRVLGSVRVQIVDADGNELPDNQVGMVRCRSQTSAETVYKEASRATGDRIVDGWGYTGDLGRIDSDGFLTLVGRSADVILRSGINIYPAEIEVAISSIDGVASCAAVGFPDPALGEDIAVFIVADRALTEDFVLARAQVALPAGKRPSRVVFLDELPRNANGKVLTKDLRETLTAAT